MGAGGSGLERVGANGRGWKRSKVWGKVGRGHEGLGKEELSVMLTVSNMYLSVLCSARLDYLPSSIMHSIKNEIISFGVTINKSFEVGVPTDIMSEEFLPCMC